jgi:hypothetical protein
MSDEHFVPRTPTDEEVAQKPKGVLPCYDEIDTRKFMSDIQESLSDIKDAVVKIADRSTLPLPTPQDTLLSSYDSVLVTLGPIERWKYMAIHSIFSFILCVVAVIVAIYAVLSSGEAIKKYLSLSFFTTAYSQNSSPSPPIIQGDVPIQYIVISLLGLVIIWSLLTITYSKTARSITLAHDLIKTIIGFFIGLFSGTRVR